MLRFVCRFPQFPFLINFDGVLPPPPPPTPPLFKRWGHFNFEKLKSFRGRAFLSYGRTSAYGEHSDNGNQRRGGGIIQVKTIILWHFLSRKSNFYGHFQKKNSFDFYIISFKITYANCSLMMISWGKYKLMN